MSDVSKILYILEASHARANSLAEGLPDNHYYKGYSDAVKDFRKLVIQFHEQQRQKEHENS